MAKGGSKIGAYFIGFVVGVIATMVFFYFGGWDLLARSGDKVERRVRHGVSDMKDSVEDAGEDVADKADEWVDENFKK